MKTRDKPAIAPGPSPSFSAELLAVWDVAASSVYDIRTSDQSDQWVAIRTRAGAGAIEVEGHARIRLEAQTLLLVERRALRRYRCDGESWCFWWFVFKPAGSLPAARLTPFSVLDTPQDEGDFAQVFTKLQNPAYPVRAVASALFSAMLLRWLADEHLQRESTPHRRIVETMIERIHLNVGEDWPGARLAREAGLSESAFRRAFKDATGQSPGRFIHEARLRTAYQMCRQGNHTLAAIAEALHFSSAFHLSAAFKRFYGVSPSRV